jgi:membrane associated rhomboid family serine protease
MPFLALVAIVATALFLIIVLKVAFGLLGWVFGNLLGIAFGAILGFYYGRKAKSQT